MISQMFECEKCGVQLPLRPVADNEQAEVWQCTNCGKVQTGKHDCHARLAIRHNAQRVFSASIAVCQAPMQQDRRR